MYAKEEILAKLAALAAAMFHVAVCVGIVLAWHHAATRAAQHIRRHGAALAGKEAAAHTGEDRRVAATPGAILRARARTNRCTPRGLSALRVTNWPCLGTDSGWAALDWRWAGAKPWLDLGTDACVLGCVDAEARLAVPATTNPKTALLCDIRIDTACIHSINSENDLWAQTTVPTHEKREKQDSQEKREGGREGEQRRTGGQVQHLYDVGQSTYRHALLFGGSVGVVAWP